MTNQGIVYMKEDRRVYMGKTGDMLVNRLGFTTIKEAAIAQRVASQNSVIVASIESVDVAATGVAVIEKRRTVHPAAGSPYQRPSGDARVPATQSRTQPPHFGPTDFILFATPTPAPGPPAIQNHSAPQPEPAPPATVLVPSTPSPMDEDMTTHVKEPRSRRTKTWSNWQLAAREKLRTGGSGNLLMMEFKSLINPTVWNWLWDDKDAIISYVWEDEFVTVFR